MALGLLFPAGPPKGHQWYCQGRSWLLQAWLTNHLESRFAEETLVRAELGRSLSAGWERWSFLSAQHWWDTSGVQSPALCSPVKGDMGILEWVQQRWRKVHWDWDIRHSREAEWAGFVQLEEEKAHWVIISMCINTWWWCKEGGTRVFPVFSAAYRKEERPWQQTEVWETPYSSNNVQGFVDCESSWTLENVVQRCCGVSILEKFKTKLDMAPCNLLNLFEQVGLEDLQRSLPISALLFQSLKMTLMTAAKDLLFS